MAEHRPVANDERLSPIALASRVEYVGGPLDGQSQDRVELPEWITSADGRYRRSVRCAEDGAMRYVWIVPEARGRT